MHQLPAATFYTNQATTDSQLGFWKAKYCQKQLCLLIYLTGPDEVSI